MMSLTRSIVSGIIDQTADRRRNTVTERLMGSRRKSRFWLSPPYPAPQQTVAVARKRGTMGKGDVHVVRKPDTNRRQVKQDGEVQSTHRTQRAAIDRGATIARREKVDVVTHGRDGKIRSKDSYGNETRVRDTEH
jgi:hypothetical protein